MDRQTDGRTHDTDYFTFPADSVGLYPVDLTTPTVSLWWTIKLYWCITMADSNLTLPPAVSQPALQLKKLQAGSL